ncbi:hypothetical protein [Marinilabilia rubra]|uniref:hypothetical protein n=1 Tax=Marinilabilia rubra TaxID=2162893 RepID=UPI0011B207DC|nr:hypothetical protein [Marinilabilia rubra]
MKQKIISITLLLSFLTVLLHEMVPHHHHEVEVNEDFSVHSHSGKHAHHAGDSHHEHEESHSNDSSNDSESEQPQNFPLHFHPTTFDDYDFARVENSHPTSQNLSLLAVELFGNLSPLNPDPPEHKQIKFWNHTIPLFSIFIPGVIGLRAPPFFT